LSGAGCEASWQRGRARCAILVTTARAGRWVERRRLQGVLAKRPCALRAILIASARLESWGGAGSRACRHRPARNSGSTSFAGSIPLD
jgi:hypothetical protein